ncbi:ABC-type nitrate/sulfonate/bicarbonate transport system, substrate-binding protein [Nitratireductor aquibiodomus]|uniref:ABC-type nitrate/sulfonate/bicarbonate transport system, substrate-binding protein n=1 Tax=Nitratireductor aquibiodomus TaxID=204799 RepID=A0A1H4JEX7_9HYPH|nr:ABC transporter substrate-binding protein [Nitratireductor aquibiodomus]SEB44536.1 ABC-type nitrate/sulfonate/bicarbonate transport system, substrate-binding protein [Nitratireductor aquibiodomus]
MKLTRRNLMLGAMGSAAMLSFPGRGHAQDSFNFITPFTLSLAFAPVIYADAAGYYAEEGLAMNLQAGKGAALAAQMTIARQMDAGRTGGTNYIVSRVNNDAPLISIATIAQRSPFFVLSSKENPVKTIADLEGRTVGMATLGGSMEGTLDLMMTGAGASPGTVNKVKVADSAASFALIEAGRAGAFLGNTSSMIIASSARDDVEVMPIDDGMPGQVYVARPDEIAENPNKFISFLRATHRAAAEIVDAEDLTPILAKIGEKHDVTGLNNTETAQKDLHTNAQNWASRGKENILRNVPEVWERAVGLLADAKLIDKAVPASELYTNNLLDQALKA